MSAPPAFPETWATCPTIVTQTECEIGTIDSFEVMRSTAVWLWRDSSKDMRVSRVRDETFTVAGECPHCHKQAAFSSVTSPFETNSGSQEHTRLIGVARCIACNDFIMVSLKQAVVGQEWKWIYDYHYPLGKPDDSVDKEIPEHIAKDFSEALRCHWVEAYNATAEMCRRVVEASCINLGAPYKKVLQDMINWLESQRIITPALKNVAHQIRLGGDRAAHPPEDPAATPNYEPSTKIEKDHAGAIVEYTRHFLEHVYVIPKRLPTFDFSKPKKL